MEELQDRRWIRRHALFAPFGIFVTTALLVYFGGGAERLDKDALELSASMVDLAAVLYAMVAVAVERVIRMWFWALDQREKWRAKWRREAQAEGRAEGQIDLLNRMWTAARAEGNQELVENLERTARELGIALGEPSPR